MFVVIVIERSMFMSRMIVENAVMNEIEYIFYVIINYSL